MNGQGTAGEPGARTLGLLEKLMGAVRGEFRADVLVFDAGDPIFGGGVCRITGCARSARGHGMCQGHHRRWQQSGRPDLEHFIASTDPRWRRGRPNMACCVVDCGYGSSRRGMCVCCTLSGGNVPAAPTGRSGWLIRCR